MTKKAGKYLINENNNEESNDENDSTISSSEMPVGEIMKNGVVTIKNKGVSIHCLTIIGQIEGHYILSNNQKSTKYEHIIPLLVSVEENPDVDGLLVILNTVGGDVEAGLAIAEMIASMEKPTVSLVLGGGHSIGVPLAVSSRKSFIVPSATMTIHPVRLNGLVVGAPQTYYYLNRMQDRILNFISSHSNVTEAKLRELLMKTDEIATDIGSILEGKEAVDAGIIDEVGGLSKSLEALRSMVKKDRKHK